MPFIRYDDRLKQTARELRKNQTFAEKEMWRFLKENYSGFKFLRQKPLYYFIPDFYCIKKSLIIEVDGGVHKGSEERDKERDDLFYYKYKITTIRFTNDEVLKNKKLLKEKLDNYLFQN